MPRLTIQLRCEGSSSLVVIWSSCVSGVVCCCLDRDLGHVRTTNKQTTTDAIAINPDEVQEQIRSTTIPTPPQHHSACATDASAKSRDECDLAVQLQDTSWPFRNRRQARTYRRDVRAIDLRRHEICIPILIHPCSPINVFRPEASAVVRHNWFIASLRSPLLEREGGAEKAGTRAQTAKRMSKPWGEPASPNLRCIRTTYDTYSSGLRGP